VKPLLEVLVGKTVEQSLIEVMEEEELSNLREQQRQFQELRNAELVEQQRLEEEHRRRRTEKVRTPGMLRLQGLCGLEAKLFGLKLGLVVSGLGLIEIGLVATKINSTPHMTVINIHNLAVDVKTFKLKLKKLRQHDLLQKLVFLNCNDC